MSGDVNRPNPRRPKLPTKVVSQENVEHYLWGKECDGWYLVKSDGLTVILERMPPGTSEERHFHRISRQFFYVLEGQLHIEVEHHDFVVNAGEGIEVSPGQEHQAINNGSHPVRFITVSQPPSHGDRVAA